MAFVKGDWVAGVNPSDGDWRSGRVERVTGECVYVRMLAAARGRTRIQPVSSWSLQTEWMRGDMSLNTVSPCRIQFFAMEQQRALLCKAAVRRKDLEQQRVLFSKVVRRKDLKYTVQAWPASVFLCQDALLVLGDDVVKVDIFGPGCVTVTYFTGDQIRARRFGELPLGREENLFMNETGRWVNSAQLELKPFVWR